LVKYETPSRILQHKENSIRQKASNELKNEDNYANIIWQKPSAKSPAFTLGWSHYLILMIIDNPLERSFYEIE